MDIQTKSMRKRLPEVSSPTTEELRAIYRRYPEGHEVHRLVIDVIRARRQMSEIEHLRLLIEVAWNEETAGKHLVALYKLRLLVQDELRRTGDCPSSI